MRSIPFAEFEAALAKPRHTPGPKGRLVIAEAPKPFVPPMLAVEVEDSPNPLGAEVVFVEALAAVGKSTMARQLSASRGIPMLNLADVPVSTGTLRTLIAELIGPGDPVAAFDRGELPIIIDALDEGRVLSNEAGFEAFLTTTGELLLQNRTVTNRPKLIIFGRHESVQDANIGLQIGGEGVICRSLEVGFFGQDDARKLIDAYARSAAKPDAAFHSNPKPVQDLIDAYFRAIESALSLEAGTLWTDERGRAFAGYAPVLAALGYLLAEMDNFVEVSNRLRAEGAREAWAVIETVLEEILKRERGKLCEKLAPRISVPVPAQAYDAYEQLSLLVRHIHGEPGLNLGRVPLKGADLQTYHAMVEQLLSEHPFVRQREPRNAVLGSVIMAHAITHDLVKDRESRFLPELSRQPFLWRSLRRQLQDEQPLIDGSYLGFILNSYWNEPVLRAPRVVVRSIAEVGSVRAFITGNDDRELSMTLAAPIRLYGQARDCDIDVSETVRIEGHAPRGGTSLFLAHGQATIICSSLDVATEALLFDGDTWIEAAQVTSPPKLKLHLKRKDARVGWGGALVKSYPWRDVAATLPPPYGHRGGDAISELIAEGARRLAGAGVLTLAPDLGAPDDDERVNWIRREFPKSFPAFISLMETRGLVTIDKAMSAHGDRKVRAHFNVTWPDLHRALREPAWNRDLTTFLNEARASIKN